MRIDLYTKTMLTVIAAALVWFAARDVLPGVRLAQAAEPKQVAQPQEVTIVGVKIPIGDETSKTYSYKLPVALREVKWIYGDSQWTPLPVQQVPTK
jgi:hypothetical protein